MRPYESTGKGSYSSQNLNPVKTGAAGWKFSLDAGKYFMYTHYYSNSAQGAITLNIGSTGAKPIYINGNPSSSTNYILPGGQYLVYYDGTNYQFRTDNKIPGNIDGDATTVNGHSVSANVPSTAVFTDTWIPLSVTQGGYISTAAPDENTKFLRGDATWATLPAASSTVAGITKVGASGGAAAYSHGTHVTTASVKEALGTSTTHNSQFLRKDGTWQTVDLTSGVTSIGTLSGDVSTSDLISELGLSTAMHFRGIATVTITEGSKTNPTISGYTFGTNGASALAGDVILDKDSQYEYVWTKNGNTGSWELLGSSESYSLSSHTHGNLTNDGKITTTATIANGDKLVIVDSDNTAKSKIVGSSITFDGSTTSNALTQAGTWETFNNYTHPTGDGNSHVPVTSTTSEGLYLKAGSTANSASWSAPTVWHGTCSTSAATVIKDVVCPSFPKGTNLVAGTVIFVYFSNTNSGAVGSIKLRVNSTADGDAKPIKYLYNGDAPANIPNKAWIRGGQTYYFSYDGTNWVIRMMYNTNDGLYYLRQHTIKAQTAITNVHIIGGTASGYNHIDAGTSFDIRYAVLYAGSNIAAAETGNNNYIFHYAVSVKDSSNTNISGLTSYKNIYIKGTISEYTFTPISGGNPYVQDITEEDDGYVYYYIGRAYGATAITFDATGAKIYWYKDGSIKLYSTYTSRASAAALSTTANDVAYYTDTNGTFGSISSADGALYSTTANGALQWGTLPIAQGGTNKTSWTQWGIVYASTTQALAQVTAGASGNSGQALISNGAAAPGWYGGLKLTGTTASNWIAAFAGNKDASSTTTAAVTIAGGLGVNKQLYVGTQATIGGIKIATGTANTSPRTIEATSDDLYINGLNNKGIIFQQAETNKIRLVGDTFYPETTNNGTLGLAANGTAANARRWAAAYIGNADTYGDTALPIYWNDGVPTYTNGILQKKSFSFANDTTTTVVEDTAYNQLYGIETFVMQIVVTEGEEYLNSPITWVSAQKENSTTTGQITLSCTEATTGIVNGYILTARGVDLDPAT